MSSPVLLLRAPNGSPDPYESALTQSAFRPFSVAVLETVLVNDEELKRIVKAGPNGSEEYSGVIVTSARAAEAWGKAVEEIVGSDQGGVLYVARISNKAC